MPSNVSIKTCGLTTVEAVSAAMQAGADYLGFVFFPSSVRHISAEQAREITLAVPPHIKKVAVTVNVDHDWLASILKIFPADLLQLHGGESPVEVKKLKARFGLPIIKAIPVCDALDIRAAEDYRNSADILLFDAKSLNPAMPGGTGTSFDWELLSGWKSDRPWFLSGGLTPENVALALKRTQAPMLDVSSGIESSPGVKDAGLIHRFIENARHFL